MKALHYNALTLSDFEAREIETDFKVVDEFYIQTNKGPLLAGVVWKDTEKNRKLINKSIELNKKKKRLIDETSKKQHQLMNQRDK